MYCYNCGTDCKEDRFCSNCGCRVGKPEEREKIYPDPPLGAYWCSIRSYLVIHRDSVRIHVDEGNSSFKKFFRLDRTIMLEDIANVEIKYTSMSGYLIIREKGNVLLTSNQEVDLSKDIDACRFDICEKAIFTVIYEFLRKCCEINHSR